MRKRSTVCGSAYVFALGPDCNDNGDADFCDIRDGASRFVDLLNHGSQTQKI